MQQESLQEKNAFKNGFCDIMRTALNTFLPVEESEEMCLEFEKLTADELLPLARFAFLLNKCSGIGEVNVFAPSADVLPLFEEFGLDGKLILPLEAVSGLRAKDFVGERIALFVPSLLELEEKELSEISDLAGKMKLPVFIGFGKSLDEVGLLDQRYKLSPARILEDFGFLDRECYLLGCNFIDKDDLEIIASYGAKVILTPRSDMMLGRGAVNLYSIENKGISYSFGSDVCPVVDVASEAALARGNTANLLYERGLIKPESLKNAILMEGREGDFQAFPLENIMASIGKQSKEQTKMLSQYKEQAEKVIKEKIWKS